MAHGEQRLCQVKPERGMYPWRRKQLRYQETNDTEEKVAKRQQRDSELLRKARLSTG